MQRRQPGGGRRLRPTVVILAAALALSAWPGTAHALLGSAPANTSPPVISGTPEPGQSLSCSQGSWSNAPLAFAYQWNRDGTPIPLALLSTYTIAPGDLGSRLTCTVTASNLFGLTAATSAAVTVRATGSGSPGTPPSATSPGGGKLPSARDLVRMPSSKRCASRRRFRIQVKQTTGVSFASVAVYVNGKRVKLARGARVTAPVDLRGLPAGRFTVRIVVKTSDGRVVAGARKYRTCASKRARKHGHRL